MALSKISTPLTSETARGPSPWENVLISGFGYESSTRLLGRVPASMVWTGAPHVVEIQGRLT
jgi:hypothetical protein